jgi:hypothetical protein
MKGPLERLLIFIPICYQTWPAHANFVSDWLISRKSSPLKPHGQMNRTWYEASMDGPL